MLKIAFIVGKSNDEYPKKVTSKNAPVWLKKGSIKFKDFINDDNTVPSDVAMASYINYYHGAPKRKTIVTLFDGDDVGKDLTLKKCNEQDVIFVIYDAIEVFHCSSRKTCPIERNNLMQMLKRTTAFVCPPPDFHNYIIHKNDYYADLQRAGIPIAPFRGIQTNRIRSVTDAKKLKTWIQQKKWEGIIIKPIFAGYSIGIKIFKNINRTSPATISQHFVKLRKLHFKKVVIQKFIPTFAKHYEIRTYWLNGKYTNSVATKPGSSRYYDTFKNEGGRLPNKILPKLKTVGRQVLQSILQYPYKHPMIRIDFGCCLSSDNCVESYFVNEVETMAANLLATATKFPIVERLAEICYKFARARKGHKNIKGRKSTKKFKRSVACKRQK